MAKESHVRIANHHTAAIGLPPVSKHEKGTDAPEVSHEQKHLMPGRESNVNAEHWAAVKGKTPVKEFLREGLLSEIEGGDTSKPEGESKQELADMTEHNAIKSVNAMSKDDLMGALNVETRPAVKTAIERKMESLGVSKVSKH